ncbi:ATP-dependent zinc metalloprotease FtsH [Salisediminibacterium halotolerans]|uniref:ATP-dependent zinc metalloprotease FtsH n=1 Tax=Salisediminibacterium halotolerans TaxID=517425 RepID=A0A1H9VS87_9BACI|nr:MULTISPECIES: ATP-dependent zinc metalloprotease FtsH [Salisediminibacterium]RLJ80940.1 membrane protease FtsH catalytic subunit [Actinophytocola xinjiangensis]RPE83655.1 membrane protease FtsH catalytic subunit [Salisediminibacterium halotolerans]TWG37865.1 membrane protease FtsH catalytic subunit [Salisediminibacterium halotolerans]SES24596.1 cell division protease FtsH [Salisediminibacterium haloalkalitolerans]GEL06997.1 ATP-dependent zinc metalloprotease FtsH [Salisediminibacterium halo
MNRIFRNTIFYLLIFLVIVGIVSVFQQEPGETEEITFTEFQQELEADNVESLEIQPNLDVYTARGQLQGAEEDEFFTVHVPDLEMFLEEVVYYTGEEGLSELTVEPADEPGGWVTFFTAIIPFVIIFILFFFLLSQSQGGGNKMMNFGKSKAKLVTEDKKTARFRDVAGADEEKQELTEVVDFLKDPRKFADIGARIPKGVLLVGPPGTGKTLIARAVAGEAGVPFFSISGSDFVEMFVGVGASRVRDLFENAKKNSPCIIFIDEIDAVGRRRGAGVGGGHDEREQTLNQLLVEMDGFGVNEGIILIAATNRADILDPALLRPGRFDRQIMIGRPDVKGREAVLGVHAKEKPLADDVELKVIAQRTPGFSGADLENLLNEAALVAARSDKKKIDMESVEEAIDRTIAGPSKKSRVISEKEKNIVAHHEAGHTVVGMKLENADMVHKVTIVPRGQAGGYAMMLPKEDRYFMTKPELIDKIIGLLGGRVAEEVMFNEVSTGAHNDFQRATGIARKMVMEYGMSDKLGPVQFGNTQGEPFLGRDMQNEQNYSDAIAHEIDMEVQQILKDAYESCRQILTEHKASLELVAEMLIEHETLDAEQIRSLVEDGKLPEDHHFTKKINGEEPEDIYTGDAEEAEPSAEEGTDEPDSDDAGADSDSTSETPEEDDQDGADTEESDDDSSGKKE